jgi:hypothetical protein
MKRVRLLTSLAVVTLFLAAIDPASATIDCTVSNCKVDFLFVIDNSDSMGGHQAALAAAADEMANQLSTAGIDWRLAVAYSDLRGVDSAGAGTTCDGAPGPGSHVLCPFTRDIALFREGSAECAYAHPGVCGSGTERGFNPLRFALDRFHAGAGCEAVSGGECAFRPEANLVVVFVTDTGEQTPDGPPPPGTENTVAAWAAYFTAQGVDAIHGIDCPTNPTPDNPAPCGDGDVPASDYDRYRDIIAVFGGVEGSILDSGFSETIQRIIDAPQNTAATTTSTTSTTLPGVCPRACEDDDPCTADICESHGCRHQQATGFEAITCLLGRFCGDRPLPGKVLRQIKKAKALIVHAQELGAHSPKAVQLLARASRRLGRAAHVADRLARRGRLPQDCSVELQRVLGRAKDRIRTLRFQLRA